MMCTMKRCVALLGLFVLAGAIPASATVTYQSTSVPTFTIQTGRAEAMGSVRITATNTGPSVASTVQYLYQGVACDNNFASGITITTSGVYSVVGNVSSATVGNTAAGCTVSFLIAGGLAPAVGDFVEVGGVRGRIDLAFGVSIGTGGSVLASINASPSNSSLFNPPTTLVVATLEPGLIVSTAQASALQCVGTTISSGAIRLKEGFNSAFVQHVPTVGGSPAPLNARPLFGANRNTRIHIVVYNLPTGTTITFPATQNGSLGAYVPAVSGSQLQLISGGPAIAGGGPGTMSDVVYEYACGNQAVCDVNQESFTISFNSGNVSVSAASGLGTASANAQLYPPLIAGDATLITDSPFGAGTPRPRFNDPLQPVPPSGFLQVAPCTSNLLFPWVVSNVAGFDTGIAIANTSKDPFGAFGSAAFAGPQHGTCTLTGFPKGEGTPVVLNSGDISAGDTFTVVLSGTAFNGFAGYIIARCGFQYGHGFAFLSNNFGTGMAPTVGQGYIALLIPDPVILGGRAANDSSEQFADCTWDEPSGFLGFSACTNNAGEGLNN